MKHAQKRNKTIWTVGQGADNCDAGRWGGYLLEDVEVYAHGCVKEDGRQEDIEEDICRLHAQEEGKGVPKAPQIDWEGNTLTHATCEQYNRIRR